MSIPFTQYLRPHGRTKAVSIDRPPVVEAKALQLIVMGCRFELEELVTGEASMTVEKGHDTLAIEVCENGPPIIAAVDKLVTDAYCKLFQIEA